MLNPMNNLSARFSKDQRVFKQLTNKNALIDALVSLYDNATKCQLKTSDQDNINKFIQLCKLNSC
jgi:enoyl reductase-like protein